MKTIIIQSDGEHKGQDGWTPNWYLRECYAIKHAILENGYECDIWGKGHENYNQPPNFNEYDIIWCMENYGTEWIPDLNGYKNSLKIHWIIDLHWQSSSEYSRISDQCDFVVHSTRCLIDSYSKIVKKPHIWFPNGVDARYFQRKSVNKTVDIGFVGSKNDARKKFIEDLERDLNMKYWFATGNDMIDLISSFKIHFNKNISTDINYRTFETIGLGTCLLTNYDPDLELLGFIDGHNCLLYTDYQSAIDKYYYAMKNDNWRKIGDNGSKLAKRNSYTNRVRDLFSTIGVS